MSDTPDLKTVMINAADNGPVEAELQRQASEKEAQRRAAEDTAARLHNKTRSLFADALYRAKRFNGDDAFDLADLESHDRLESIADRLRQRRIARTGGEA